MANTYKMPALFMAALVLASLAFHAQAEGAACTWPKAWDVLSRTNSGLRMPVGGMHCGDLGNFPEHECCCWCFEGKNRKWCRYGQVENNDGELRGARWPDLCAGKVVVPGSPRDKESDDSL
uniref:Uncharacterized protein n=1 Tax=Chlamydomonas leiostraca TaxID=1034604 RepID=A0A7S0R067_9CHLO|mmetsp:Transcript_11570/g.28325  ORF Transcript_11570/g.28325 Transcript_11570/m.28325 type:complete len:121 (+) Transcript_11570:180-542(+)